MERVARVPKMTRGKILSVPGIHCCTISFSFPYTVKKKSVYINTSDCVETVYELPLLPNEKSKHFYTNRERFEVLTRYLSLGRRSCGDWANT
jgi:hypothetical protein